MSVASPAPQTTPGTKTNTMALVSSLLTSLAWLA